jgi:hypothetical protein
MNPACKPVRSWFETGENRVQKDGKNALDQL